MPGAPSERPARWAASKRIFISSGISSSESPKFASYIMDASEWYLWDRSSGAEHSPFKRRVMGSSPIGPTFIILSRMASKVALIAGGTRIGLVIGEALQRHDYAIILTWRSSKTAVEQAVLKLEKSGSATALKLDAASEESVSRCVQEVQGRFGHLDLLVNMASVFDLGPLTGEN